MDECRSWASNIFQLVKSTRESAELVLLCLLLESNPTLSQPKAQCFWFLHFIPHSLKSCQVIFHSTWVLQLPLGSAKKFGLWLQARGCWNVRYAAIKPLQNRIFHFWMLHTRLKRHREIFQHATPTYPTSVVRGDSSSSTALCSEAHFCSTRRRRACLPHSLVRTIGPHPLCQTKKRSLCCYKKLCLIYLT